MSSKPFSKFCLFYWSKNFNYLEFISSILWFIFWLYTGCTQVVIAIAITVGLMAILVFETYGLVQNSICLLQISFCLRCLQFLVTLGLLIFVAIAEFYLIDEKWWKVTPKTQLILACVLSFSLFYFCCKAIALFKIKVLISQENISGPTSGDREENGGKSPTFLGLNGSFSVLKKRSVTFDPKKIPKITVEEC